MSVRARNPAIFLVAAVALAGAAAMRVAGFITADVASGLPFAYKLSALVGVVAVSCAVAGAVRALRENVVRNPALHLFMWLYCVAISYGATSAVWQPLTLNVVIGSDTLRFGPDFVGIALLCWYYRIATRAEPLVPVAAAAPDPAGDPSDPASVPGAAQPSGMV
jgi:hypothetical protein